MVAARPEAGRGRAGNKVREPGVAECAGHRRGEVLSPEFRAHGIKSCGAERPPAPPSAPLPPPPPRLPWAKDPRRGTPARPRLPGSESASSSGLSAWLAPPRRPLPAAPARLPPALPAPPARSRTGAGGGPRTGRAGNGPRLGTLSHAVGRPPKGNALGLSHLFECFSRCHERV